MSEALDNLTGENPDYLSMSDEEFLKMNGPAADDAQAPGSEDTNSDPEVSQEEETLPPSGEAEALSEDAGTGPDGGGEIPASGAGEDNPAKEPKADENKEAPAPSTQPEDVADKEKQPVETQPVDYEAFYKQVMQPFKANGRTFEVRSPDEVIRLMQMGAGYGKKVQEIQPYLKVIRMLENHNLLDEQRLSYLIDLNQKNPEAIKKLVKDSGLDPLDINVSENVNYTPPNYSVSDKEVALHSAISEVKAQPNGTETLREINQNWDAESKQLLWENPEILSIIQAQREHGIYAQIAAEVDRRKTFGLIPPHTAFLKAYHAVGQEMEAAGMLRAQAQNQPIQTQTGYAPQQPQPIATRVSAPKAQVQNSAKVAAAAPPKSEGSRRAPLTINPLAMSDEDFLKQFGDRL